MNIFFNLMIFLERKHYCKKCKKEVFLPILITTKESIMKTHKCPVCSSDLISYWYEYPRKYIYMILFAMPFFIFSVIYSLLRYYQSIIEPVDIFIAISNVIFGGLILMFSSLYKKAPEPPEVSDNSLGKFILFKRQKWAIILIQVIGFLLVGGFNTLIWIIWKAIDHTLALH